MNSDKKILIAFILNLFFSIIEVFGGIITGSIAIASDALHDFGDAMSIGVSYLFEKKSMRKPDKTYTYGYARFSVLGGLLTTIILLIGSIFVIYNSIFRLIHPVKISHDAMIIFAIIGLIVNIIATYLTHGNNSLNQKAINLHMLEDVLGWVVVLIGAIVMKFSALYFLDAVLSILVAIFIITNSIKNLKETLDVLLLKTPKNLNIETIKNAVLSVDGILSVQNIRLFSTDGKSVYITVCVIINEYDFKIKNQVKERLFSIGISQVTVETIVNNEPFLDANPNDNKIPHACCKHCHHH
ncbi:MAG: cation transporter [Clostridia bacterium]|nr:cation transporter [Clostridia bacterium]